MKLDSASTLTTVTKACRHAFGYVALFSFLVNLLLLTVPLYMLQLFDRVLASQGYDTLIYLSLIAAVALLTLGLLDIARARVLTRVSRWLDNQLSPLALFHSADDQLMGGSYGPQSLKDITNIRQFVSSPGIFSLFDAPWTPLYLLVVYLLHPFLGLLATVGAVFLFLLALLNEKVTRPLVMEANQRGILSQQYVTSTLSNAESIQAMGMLPQVIRRWFEKNEPVLNLQSLANDRSTLLLSTAKFFRLVLQIGMLGTGAYLVITNRLTPGAMIAASIISARALAPIEQSMMTWKQWVGVRQAYYRLQPYIARKNIRGEGIQLPTPTGQLTVEKLTYMPRGASKPILQNIAFQLDAGETLVILGASGAGKSTLVRLMLGVWFPSSGCVRLDGANVFYWDRIDFGKHVGYLPQDVELFAGTVKDNIARMQDEGADEAIIDAAKFAGAHEMILNLQGGYDFIINPYNLSGGQRQRIALARAFYGNPKLVVLDEPAASLDQAGDAALLQALRTAHERGITVVLISHRPNVLAAADKVAIIQNGVLQQFGPRDEVIEQVKAAHAPREH